MAATSGLFATLALDLLAHITPASGTTATAVTVTGPLKIKLVTTTSTNSAAGTECADANYTAGGLAVSAWNAAGTTTGAGYGVGYVSKTNSTVLNFPQGNTSTGFAATASLAGFVAVSSDGTPVNVFYSNFASTVSVPAGNVYQFSGGTLSLGLS